MRFLSIYMCPERNTPPSPDEMATMGKLVEDWMKSGKLLATEGCLPSSLGARVRVDNRKHSVSDGPFTESKEVVGGFAILDAPSKEVAIGYVKEFLNVVGQGTCELRQLYDANCMPCVHEKAEVVAAN
ncbi:YciI family protein [Occallatibacter savannae]|uniref:YciI family protein n=1 Tax=Occallatibacter savannae TaxID=1002691 RepID=UPI000D690EA9|nr:YciI family protein [Occallatibacter savannae]